ncbi:hypothetical protein [Pseudomonas paeninsulae]|uniref:hypothetical protein n=1 Tax=Pseudomonas paeninsulae TaxID=3110772 RepID=UPI002D771FCC|nr:hypothetical protein [Pseudomonas sp. IT1137]
MGSPVEIVKRSSAQATDLPDVHSSAFADLFDRCGDTRLVLLGEASQRCQVVVSRCRG